MDNVISIDKIPNKLPIEDLLKVVGGKIEAEVLSGLNCTGTETGCFESDEVYCEVKPTAVVISNGETLTNVRITVERDKVANDSTRLKRSKIQAQPNDSTASGTTVCFFDALKTASYKTIQK